MKTAVEWLMNELEYNDMPSWMQELFDQAKEMENQQLFFNSAKESYKAGQRSMKCGCYNIDDCTTFEDWLYNKNINK